MTLVAYNIVQSLLQHSINIKLTKKHIHLLIPVTLNPNMHMHNMYSCNVVFLTVFWGVC